MRAFKITSDNCHYKIIKNVSIYTFRKGKNDIVVQLAGFWGGRDSADNKKYRTILRIAEETGEILRKYEPVPENIINKALSFFGD